MNSKTHLITGATGDTGSNAVRLLLERGHTVKALVHKRDGRSAKLAELGADVVVGDLLDFEAVRALSMAPVGRISFTQSPRR